MKAGAIHENILISVLVFGTLTGFGLFVTLSTSTPDLNKMLHFLGLYVLSNVLLYLFTPIIHSLFVHFAMDTVIIMCLAILILNLLFGDFDFNQRTNPEGNPGEREVPAHRVLRVSDGIQAGEPHAAIHDALYVRYFLRFDAVSEDVAEDECAQVLLLHSLLHLEPARRLLLPGLAAPVLDLRGLDVLHQLRLPLLADLAPAVQEVHPRAVGHPQD
jgi:hypothetical protein